MLDPFHREEIPKRSGELEGRSLTCLDALYSTHSGVCFSDIGVMTNTVCGYLCLLDSIILPANSKRSGKYFHIRPRRAKSVATKALARLSNSDQEARPLE